MMRHLLYIPWLLAILIACAQIGLPVAQTLDERLTAAVSSVTALRDSTTVLLNQKKITSADAEHIREQLQNARAGLDIVRTMIAADPVGASTKLTSMVTVLTALQTYLASKGA